MPDLPLERSSRHSRAADALISRYLIELIEEQEPAPPASGAATPLERGGVAKPDAAA
jgi:hypothetical protein